jgi:uncharacterized phage protein (TIGR02218 family)
MKSFSAEYAAHIATGATTLCHCWLLERMDGTKFGFTDHDRTLAFGGNIYLPTNGLDGGEVVAKLGPQVDTKEVAGILSSSAITEDDIVLGRYDGARVTTFRVNWRDVLVRATQRVDTIGEIIREDGYFRAELRSQQQSLNIARGRRYQSTCDAELGGSRCGVDIESTSYKAPATISVVVDRFTLEMTGLGAFASGWFSHGKAVWLSGSRLNIADSIAVHANENGSVSISFAEPVGDWVAVGDQLSIYAGCDRRFSTCIKKFLNSDNFQGFPHIPGSDFILSFPRSGDALQGGAYVE